MIQIEKNSNALLSLPSAAQSTNQNETEETVKCGALPDILGDGELSPPIAAEIPVIWSKATGRAALSNLRPMYAARYGQNLSYSGMMENLVEDGESRTASPSRLVRMNQIYQNQKMLSNVEDISASFDDEVAPSSINCCFFYQFAECGPVIYKESAVASPFASSTNSHKAAYESSTKRTPTEQLLCPDPVANGLVNSAIVLKLHGESFSSPVSVSQELADIWTRWQTTTPDCTRRLSGWQESSWRLRTGTTCRRSRKSQPRRTSD